jgi:hypothetical protein
MTQHGTNWHRRRHDALRFWLEVLGGPRRRLGWPVSQAQLTTDLVPTLASRPYDVVPANSYVLVRPCCLVLVHLLSLYPEPGAIQLCAEIQDASLDPTDCRVPRNVDEAAVVVALDALLDVLPAAFLDTLLAVVLDMIRAVSAGPAKQQ